ncbi:MAG: 5-formyltetrahydrofolate cyclo-ligase [Paludibacteraceae bacterium]|nr:5-formyltetrahydrofolate cyclo-ligase [Paludibacteraceae bacterium]
MDKQEVRRNIRELKKEYGAERLEALSVEACHNLELNPVYDSAAVVLLYSSLPDEVDTSALIQRAIASGKTVVLPVVMGDELELRVYSGEDSLEAGSFGILEPTGESYIGDIDVAVVPGVAFSQDGVRLGRGKGFYDRLLTQLPCYKIGLCFSFQKMDLSALAEPHDVLMDEVVSD